MIGLFLRNKANEVCFVQASRESEIASFHYAAHAKMITVIMADGAEETVTTEIAPEIHEVLVPAKRILVALLDDKGDMEREYWAELSVA
jgi:hypothetical protein